MVCPSRPSPPSEVLGLAGISGSVGMAEVSRPDGRHRDGRCIGFWQTVVSTGSVTGASAEALSSSTSAGAEWFTGVATWNRLERIAAQRSSSRSSVRQCQPGWSKPFLDFHGAGRDDGGGDDTGQGLGADRAGHGTDSGWRCRR